ncbi:MAG: hypothetical protein M3370_08690 [Actinomycetota bacterium]|nr:hypothetical protein [Actinomycetota bacterium]
MSNELITYIVAGLCGLLIVVAFVWLIAVPAWKSYSRLWERIAASFLSLFVLAALVMAGVAGGAAIVYFWDSIAG